MARLPRWVGPKTIKLDPSYPQYFRTGEGSGWKFLYHGPFTALQAAIPAPGSTVTGFAGYTVQNDLSLKPLGAGVTGPGVMEFSAARFGVDSTEDDEPQTITEIDAGRLEKSILTLPVFQAINRETVAKIKQAIDNNESVPGPSLPGPVEEAVQQLYDRLLLGQDTYFVPAPVVRMTTYSSSRPTVNKIGKGTRTADKPHPAAPNGYVWLMTADRATQTGPRGLWVRVREWTAADDWDALVYGA